MKKPIVIVLVALAFVAAIIAAVVIFWPWLTNWLPQTGILEAWLTYFVVDLNIGRWGPVATLLLVALIELVWALNLGRKSESVERHFRRLEKTHAKEVQVLNQELALMKDERAALLAELDLREDLIREERARLWAQFDELQRSTGMISRNEHAPDQEAAPGILRSKSIMPGQPGMLADVRGEWLRLISQLERIEMVSTVTVRTNHTTPQQPLRVDELLRLGGACHRLGQFERALGHYDRVIQLTPNNHEALINRAVVNLDLGRNQAALQDLDRAMKLGENAWTYLYRGVIQEHLGEERRAQENYSRAIRLEPSLAEAYYWRALRYLRSGEYDRAFQDVNRVLELDGEQAMAYTVRGRARAALGDSQWALSDLDKGCSLAPALPDPFLYRGLVRRQLAMYEEALVDFTRALELDPDLLAAYVARGETFAMMEKHEQAIADYDRAIELESKRSAVYEARAQARAAVGEFELAVEDYDQALDLEPDSANSLAHRGAAYQELGQYDEAILDLDRALVLDPNLASAYYVRALAHGSKGEYDRASRDLDRAVELDPSFSEKEHGLLGARST
jgi:tetratricopeptide (TPR) repeat protein